MDRTTVTRLFKTTDRLKKRRFLVALVVVLILLSPSVLAHLFFWRIEYRLNLHVDDKPFLTLVPGRIHLTHASLNWKEKLRVTSGDLRVRFPISAVLGGRYTIVLDGESLAVQLGPELRKSLGSDTIVFDRFQAKIRILSKRDIRIDFLNAESKTIQFHLTGNGEK
ncbi:MAG: hypothetical protein HY588_01925 [Candidatus Omnitrophica bacterium]|nr:hypothetical protein [Candidatus Omnitrophota bacterium]